MNAPTTTSKPNPMQTFVWLLKREYWEHRGGFFWAPLIAGGVVIAITVLSMIIAEATAARHGVKLSNMNLDAISRNMTADQISQFNAGLTVGLMGLSIPIMITLSFVVFFYLLGALYDDRRDRSALFWKSLPVSDLDTVLSKVAAAVLLAPLFAIAATIVLHLAFLVVVSVYAGLHGVNPLPLLWNPAPLLAMWIKLVLLIPLNALWALPTVGWLLFCSAFARSRPFLWAVAVPVAFGAVMGFTQLLQQFSIPSSWYWRNIVCRILFGMVPGGWFGLGGTGALKALSNGDDVNIALDRFDVVNSLLSWNHIFGALGSPDLWIGAAAGAGLIVAAIYFRRQRIETSV
jgi:ABC-2 type transport system permease protein